MPRRADQRCRRTRPVATHTFLALALMCGGPAACAASRRANDPGLPTSAAAEARARIEMRESRQYPAILLIERQGDPRSAIAFASAHDLGGHASAALAALIRARLARSGFADAEPRAHGLGFGVVALVATADEARRFVAAAAQALRTPVGSADASAIIESTAALRGRTFSADGDAPLMDCSGELGARAGSSAPPNARGVEWLESARRTVASTRATGFAAVGTAELLEAAADSLSDSGEWPEGAAPDDPWPGRDAVAVTRVADGPRRLSVALRFADVGRALGAARQLSHPASSLALRLDAFEPSWQVNRVVATARPRGACVRVDLRAPKADPGPSLAEVARVITVALEEQRRASGGAIRSDWVLDDTVLRPTDPRESASIAAWRTLVDRREAGPERMFVSYIARPSDAVGESGELSRELTRAASSWAKPSVELRTRVETGQGELWAMIGSPCGTVAETGADAGLSALVMRAIAEKRARSADVALEPWVTADGIGLLAHAPRLSPTETARAHAERVGSALGQALVATRLTGADVAQSRLGLLDELGGPRPGWHNLLDALAPDHPAWLDPRGTWQTVSSIASHGIEMRRRSLAMGPLKVVVLASSDEEQGRILSNAVERWLRPVRSEPRSCADPTSLPPRFGEQLLETTSSVAVTAYVAATLPATLTVTGREAEWAVHLLNRPGGWLEQALTRPGLATASEALVLGGSQASALVVAISALPEQSDAAVTQVRALLQRLAEGAVSDADMQAAQRHFAREQLAAELNPRRRLVDLFRGSGLASAPTVGSMRRFLRALRSDGHIVVRVTQKD